MDLPIMRHEPAIAARTFLKVGPLTRALTEASSQIGPTPRQGYRSCLGILRLGKRYGDARLEAACEHAGSRRALLSPYRFDLAYQGSGSFM